MGDALLLLAREQSRLICSSGMNSAMRGWGYFFQTQTEHDVFLSIADTDWRTRNVELNELYNCEIV